MSKWTKWDDFDYEYIHPIRVFFIVKWESLCRAVAFARFAWNKYDFESNYMFAYMAFQLQRVKQCMDTGYHVYTPEIKGSIKEAIRVCDRLYKDDYEDRYRKIHDKKWGRPRFHDKDGNFSFNIDRKNVKTKADRHWERKDSLKTMEEARKDRMADFDRLNFLFKNYQDHWSD